MKCNECFGNVEGHCLANITEKKTFKDGQKGCKYKTNAIKEAMKNADPKEIFCEGEKVRNIYNGDFYTVLFQSADCLVLKVTDGTNTFTVCTSDIERR